MGAKEVCSSFKKKGGKNNNIERKKERKSIERKAEINEKREVQVRESFSRLEALFERMERQEIYSLKEITPSSS